MPMKEIANEENPQAAKKEKITRPETPCLHFHYSEPCDLSHWKVQTALPMVEIS